ncbi:serine/threonine-protein kinase [Mycobacterium talmoniae]|uniref:non-specific serine/threonine protein kinase n=1 Tax=Mycobacterium talmoniae TaxID=1858794 RepID=A0A2S8BK62_9MYCO|nr:MULTISPECIES: serine/threonine-protein kinase [Mycobacterium]PQM46996.1 Serine/threonine-protein kinase PknH [Mycobacterium talmoniae]TDH56652.1 serine/threonine protein kinase [Mycobacterium eburneum]
MAESSFGRYELRATLGQGGMGQVFRAYDTATDREVALKVLAPQVAADETFQQRFRREAHLAARLNDPHVVPIHSYGEIDGRLYVDMRLIEGQDLGTVLRAGALDPARAVRIVEQVAEALDAAHASGLVHRDVKPPNILVTARDFVYVIDFGIARQTGATRFTSTGAAIGTFAYMAPERFETGDGGPGVDIYALACVLHECLTGRSPFGGGSMEQQIAGHLTKPPPRPSEAGASPAFDDVIAMGMAKDPAQRFQSAVALAEAARAALDGGARAMTPEVPPTLLAATQLAPTHFASTPPVPFALTPPPVGAGWPSPPAEAGWPPPHHPQRSYPGTGHGRSGADSAAVQQVRRSPYFAAAGISMILIATPAAFVLWAHRSDNHGVLFPGPWITTSVLLGLVAMPFALIAMGSRAAGRRTVIASWVTCVALFLVALIRLSMLSPGKSENSPTFHWLALIEFAITIAGMVGVGIIPRSVFNWFGKFWSIILIGGGVVNAATHLAIVGIEFDSAYQTMKGFAAFGISQLIFFLAVVGLGATIILNRVATSSAETVR